MFRAIRDVQRRAGLPVVARAGDHAEAGAGDDVDRLFTVDMTPGTRIRRDLRLQEGGALRREPARFADEHRDTRILSRLDPRELAATSDNGTPR